MRGEETLQGQPGSTVTEIPPRARGREVLGVCTRAVAGNTPACAGKSCVRSVRSRRSRKYPRVRGEERSIMRMFAPALEIPPRARGRARRTPDNSVSTGNTPACAGKSGAASQSHARLRKYPRVRGEEINSRVTGILGAEIPPRARGRAVLRQQDQRCRGNTPACAGKSLSDLQILTGVIQFLSGPAG